MSDIELLPRRPRSEFRDIMHQHVDQICDYLEETNGGMAAYCIVGFDFNGGFSRATRIHKESFLSPYILPGIVSTVLNRDVARDVAEDVMKGKL